MFSTNKIIIAVIALAITVAAVAYFLTSASSVDSITDRKKGGELPALSCSFTSGQEFDYKYQVVSESKFDRKSITSNRPGQANLYSIKPTLQIFSGTMHWKVVKEYNRGQAWKVAAIFTNVDWRIEDSLVKSYLIEEVQKPFTFIIHTDCLFSGFNISPHISADANDMVGKMLKIFEMQVDNKPGAAVYNAAQVDSTGAYVARYLIKDTDSHYNFIKEKISYSRIKDEFAGFSGPGGGGLLKPIAAKILSSETEGTFDNKGGWFTQINGIEHVQLKRGEAVFADVRGHHHLESKKTGKTPDQLQHWIDSNFLRQTPRIKLVNEDGVARIEYVPREDLTQVTWEDALERFTSRFLARHTDPTAYMEALHFLKDYLIVHPDRAFDLLDQMLNEELSADVHATVFLALELAGTPEAQQALIQAARDENMTAMNRMRAIIALMNVPIPSSEAITTLLDLSRSADSTTDDEDAFHIASTAVLALGTLNNRFEGDPEVRSTLQSELRNRLETLEDPTDLVVTLDAINNSGDEDLINDVTQVFNNELDPVRAHAVRALIRMKDARVEPILVGVFTDDQSPEVRAAAAAVIGDRSESGFVAPGNQTVKSTGQQLGVESHAKVRRELIRVIGPVAHKNPQAKNALVQQFKQETSTENLVLIGRYLPAEALTR
jgi:Lipoprotein amino terminal region